LRRDRCGIANWLKRFRVRGSAARAGFAHVIFASFTGVLSIAIARRWNDVGKSKSREDQNTHKK
jgi:hypothetical protein